MNLIFQVHFLLLKFNKNMSFLCLVSMGKFVSLKGEKACFKILSKEVELFSLD